MSEKTIRRIILIYSWIFLLAGLLFVSAPQLITELLSDFFLWLPLSIPWLQEEPTIWLALTGSMMGMLSFLSWRLSKNLTDETAWNTIILSKSISTALFATFALVEGNSLWITTMFVDGFIGSHFIWMRWRQASLENKNPWSMRYHFQQNSFYEVWFLKLNDPVSHNAFWARYTILKKNRRTIATCWYILFDSASQKVHQGRWDATLQDSHEHLIKIGENVLGETSARAQQEHVSWDIQWKKILPEHFDFIPQSLHLLGIAKSSYVTPLPLGTFNAQINVNGQQFSWTNALGSLGHIWGTRMAHEWRWAHSAFEHQGKPVIIEILSARARVGKFLLPPLTFAHLWFEGNHYQTSLFNAIARNKITPEGLNWLFNINFGELSVQGECRSGPLVADVIYDDTIERQLICHNTKTGSMTLDIVSRSGVSAAHLQTTNQAAIETVEPAP